MDNSDRAINGRRDAQTERFHKEGVYFPREEMRILLLLTKQIKQAQKVVQVDALEILCNTLEFSVVLCNTLQYSVTLCNTL